MRVEGEVDVYKALVFFISQPLNIFISISDRKLIRDLMSPWAFENRELVLITSLIIQHTIKHAY